MGITEYKNQQYIVLNGVKVWHKCLSCINKDSNWRAHMRCVRVACVDYQKAPFLSEDGRFIEIEENKVQ
jgi:hypothetical protein